MRQWGAVFDMSRFQFSRQILILRDSYPERNGFMKNLVLRLAILTVAIALAVYIVPGMEASGYGPVIEAAVVLGVLNLVIKPVLFILTLPINILSLGLFTFILNGILLLIVGALVPGLAVQGLGVAILGSVVISLFSIVAGWLVK